MTQLLVRMYDENRKVRISGGYSWNDVEFSPKSKDYRDKPRAATVYSLHDRGLLDHKHDAGKSYGSRAEVYSLNAKGRVVVEEIKAEEKSTKDALGYSRINPEAKQTSSPCPACGRSAGRRSTLVCRECLETIETATAVRELAEALAGLDSFWEPAIVPGPGRAHDLPYRPEFEDSREAQELMREAMEAGSLPLEVAARFAERYRHGARLIYRDKVPYIGNSPSTDLAPKGFVNALLRLERFWRCQIVEAYNAGYQEGQQLLRQLSQGEVTLSEFEEKAACRKAVKD